jgi:hypothetical protein
VASFVNVPPEAIETPLKQLGFFRSVEGAQVVYEKRHDCNPDVRVKVYTSINSDGSQVRRRGKDSIRVCALVQGRDKTYDIGKFPYIARVSSVDHVVKKLLTTVKAAWERGAEWHAEQAVKKVMGS